MRHFAVQKTLKETLNMKSIIGLVVFTLAFTFTVSLSQASPSNPVQLCALQDPTGQATANATSTDDPNLCTIQDQIDGLCSGPFTQTWLTTDEYAVNNFTEASRLYYGCKLISVGGTNRNHCWIRADVPYIGGVIIGCTQTSASEWDCGWQPYTAAQNIPK